MNSTQRIVILREELGRLGYQHEALVIGGVEYTKFTSSDGLTWLYRDANGMLPMPYASASHVLNDKFVAAGYAKTKNVRVPHVVRVRDELRGVADYRRLLGVDEREAIVIKPTNSTLSRGVSAQVKTDEALVAAIEKARGQPGDVVAQERIEGDEFRFVFVGTALKAVIQKAKLCVVGDGNSSIRQLLLDENRARMEITGLRVRYPQVSLGPIEAAGVALDRVPSVGEAVILNDSTMIERGASFYEVSEGVHSSYVDLAKRLAADFGGGYLAVDFIIRDHQVPANESDYAFLEFNNIPSPMFYYACRNKPELSVMRDLAHYIDEVLHLAARV